MTCGSKGNVTVELALIIAIVFVLAVAGPVFYKVFSGINDKIQTSDEFVPLSKSISQNHITQFPAIWDNVIMIILLGYAIAVVLAAIYIDTLPVFGVIMFMSLPIMLVVSMAVSNAYESFQSSLHTETALMPWTVYIMNNLPFMILGIGILGAIALYGKRRLGA